MCRSVATAHTSNCMDIYTTGHCATCYLLVAEILSRPPSDITKQNDIVGNFVYGTTGL